MIRRDDYDTKLPLNCNEEDLPATAGAAPPEPSDTWTTSTLPLIRFEINEMMRSVWVDRRRLETRRTTLTAMLTKIEHFRRRMSEKYIHLLDVSVPAQRYAKCIMHLLIYRLYIMVLHPYYANASNPMPLRLSHLLITSGIMVIELSMHLETNPMFREWAWYFGAYFQYQVALLLATEMWFRPENREAARIWWCIDYVFELDHKLPTAAKVAHLLNEISSRTAIYMRRRKMRGTSTTARAVVSSNAVAGTNSSLPDHPQQQGKQQQPVHGQPEHQQERKNACTDMAHVPPSGDVNEMSKIELGYVPSDGLPGPEPAPSQSPKMFSVPGGQFLCSQAPNTGSPHESDSSNLPAAGTIPMACPNMIVPGGVMENLDWETLSRLFNNDGHTGDLSIHGYYNPDFMASNWGR